MCVWRGTVGEKELQDSSKVTDSREKSEIISSNTEKSQAAGQQIEQANKPNTRRHQRLEFETDVTIYSENGVFPGRTLDISESGMAAILPVELKIGETR
jgi:hypothetical protein